MNSAGVFAAKGNDNDVDDDDDDDGPHDDVSAHEIAQLW